MTQSGYGASGWGSSGWGSPSNAAPRLLTALAVSENVVQLTFSAPVYYSGLLDYPDASNRRRYGFNPVAGTFGQDGTATKPVGVASVAVVRAPGQFLGQVLDVTTDRPMTPSPGQYVVLVNGLFGLDGVTPVNPSYVSATFTSVFKQLQPPQLATTSPRGDVAMPQGQDEILAGLVPNPSAITLGSFVVANGDYATQAGIAEYKGRVFRRLVTTLDAFLHLAGRNYGAGLLGYGKRLGSAQTRTKLAGSIEQQVGMEPETAAVSCKTTPKPGSPGEYYLVLLAKTKFGTALKVVAPVNASQ